MVNKKRVLNSHKNRFKSLILPIIIIFLVITLIYLTTPILTENQSTSIINKAFPFLKDIRTQKIFRSPSPPSFVPGTLPTDAELCEGITYNYDVDATDPEIDPLYFSDTTNLFDIDPNSGQITFTPTKAQVGDYRPEDKSVALVVKDPGQEGDLYIWGFIITEVNQQPVLDAITFPQASQHVPFSYQVTATDPEFDTLTYSDDTLLFDINPATGEISFTPSPAQSGSYMINISTCDNSPLIPTLTCPFSQIRCDSKLVTLNIASNNPPQIDSLPSLTATQDMLYNSFLVGSDIDNNPPGTDIITYSENSDMFVINPATGEISFTPLNVNVGNHQIQFNVTDSQGAVISQTVTFQITNVNDNPNITLIFPLNNETIFVYENLSQFFNYTVSDPDFSVDPSEVVADVWSINDIINKTLTGYKTGIEWNGNFTFNPSFDQSNGTFNKTVELKLDIYDTGSINDNETWNVTILNTNLAPVFSGSILNQTWAQNTINNNIHLLDYFSDYDNDRLIFYYNFTDGNDTIINVSID
ncbi:MAG TPA: putative Ig domain-containing protein, partial [Candidatus Nanoarchaeia archaeon]|nr:putative Ig domain-containing protein [Candidatus Nanoarchaeia archaeon]